MIIARSPLRVSLGGGGTDLPSYYREHGGFLIAAAINKFVFITVHETFDQEMLIKYSQFEKVSSPREVKHPIIREALDLVGIETPSLEITSMADIPAGTGLGSSGSFTTALLKALHAYRRNVIQPHELAEQACEIEMNRLKEPVGKQDQFIAAYGGVTCFRFERDGTVVAEPLRMSEETRANLEENLVLFFTGYTRKSSLLLKDQDSRTQEKDGRMIDSLHYVKDIGMRTRAMLENGDLRGFGAIMDEYWRHKRDRSEGMSNSNIDRWYSLAMENGALGGKLVGAGGGGFLMFYTEDKIRLRHAMMSAGLREVRFGFDPYGTTVIVQ